MVNGNLLTDRNLIRDKWADQFEALGTLSRVLSTVGGGLPPKKVY